MGMAAMGPNKLPVFGGLRDVMSDATAFCGLQELEARLLMAATPAQIAGALDLPAGTVVTYTGDPDAVTTRSGSDLFLFPTGGDDYLFLSTGIADEVDTVENTSGSQGTDLGAAGVDGDEASISFTLPVPTFGNVTGGTLKIDFTFLSEEFPEFVGSSFNDTFSITVNGTEIAVDQAGNPMSINNALFDGNLSTDGTFFDGRTEVLTAIYNVPAGTTALDIVISIRDEGDGAFDSAAIIDNIRVVPDQVVYLDFDGADVDDFFGYGTNFDVPAFSATDINGLPSQTQQTIDIIVGKLEQLFAGYNIFFVTERPDVDDYMTVAIGGTNQTAINIDPSLHPVLASQIGGQTSFKTFYEANNPNLKNKKWTLFASAELQNGAPDLNNVELNDMAVIFAGEFDATNPFANIDDLANSIAHQVANNLGARDVTDSFENEILRVSAKPKRTAKFTAGSKPLELQKWFDGAKKINILQYLSRVIGANTGQSSLTTRGQAEPTSALPHFKISVSTGQPIFNAVIGIIPGTTQTQRQDDGTIFYEVGTVDGEIFVPLATQYPDAHIFIYGSTTPGGAINVFSGTPGKDGVLSNAETQVKLFERDGSINTTIALVTGTPQSSVGFGSILIEESPFTADGFLYGNKGTFTDSDGDQYTIKLTGRGRVQYDKLADAKGFGGINDLTLVGTDSTSRLVITVQKGKKGNGQIDALTINGENVGRIVASQVNLAQSAAFDYITSLNLRNIRDLATITVDSPTLEAVTRLDLGIVGRTTTIDIAGTMDLKAQQVQFGSDITSGAAKDINITGGKGLRGNFDGNLTINEAGADEEGDGVGLETNAFGNIRIRNDARFGIWEVNGNGNRIDIGGVASGLMIDFDFSTINQIEADQLINSNINVDRRIGTLTTQRTVGGSLTTGTMSDLNVTGSGKKKGLRGELNSALTLTGDFAGRDIITLQRGRIQSTSGQTWDITGDVNLLNIGNANGLNLNADGDVNRLAINQTNGSNVAITGLLNSFQGSKVQSSTFAAETFNVFNVSQSVLNSLINADTQINSVVVGSLFGTDITAGVDDTFNLDTLSAATTRDQVFDNFSGRIKSVVVKTKGGKRRVVTGDSKIVAFNVEQADLGTVDPTNGGQFFGVAGVNVTRVESTNSGGLVPPSGTPGTVPIAGDAQLLLL